MRDPSIRRIHEAYVTGQRFAGGVPRDVISASWRRCLDAGIDPESHEAPLVYDEGVIGEIRSAHALSALLPMFRQTLLQVADETAQAMVITNAVGDVLWREGHRQVLRRADRIGLAEGFRWSEPAVGTNGIGTALATGRATHVYSAEHLARVLHEWSCTGAPVIDPDTGQILGCVDISGAADSLHPATVALVRAAARLAESDLTLRMRERDERLRSRHDATGPGALVTLSGRVIGGDLSLGPRVRLPESGERLLLSDGRVALIEPLGDGYRLCLTASRATSQLTLTVLGVHQPYAYLNGARIPLSLRHAEILTLLASHPRGLTAERLCCLLYGDGGNPVTIRAEIHRLRAQLDGAVAAKPYRLTCEVSGDFLEVRQALATGELAKAARLYQGPLLPRSEAPAIRRARDELEVRVRSEMLSRGSVEDLWAYAQTSTGQDDAEVHERLVTMLPDADQRHAAASARLDWIDD
ncbi:GAF domain-containing protein [Microbispora sp. NPDC049125]|uniref:helix-turn-helix domain-containing protein n=1 Tax=Microbispora sp. NPDC049125 TaxID=3154929 RepID=UPI0034670712